MAGKLHALFASSRPLQATLSVAQPLFAAFLAYGGIPDAMTLALLAIGSAAGMFSVFAMNDLLDYSLDKKMASTKKEGWDIDSFMERHPLAQGKVTVQEQAAWVVACGLVAALAIYTLNPFTLLLFILAVLLEIAYCRLATVSELKAAVAGALVSVGAMIGWFAAGGGMAPAALAALFLLFFAWEVGGRNIPNDFSDVEQDRALGIKTIPSVHGAGFSSRLIVALAALAIIANIALVLILPLGPAYSIIAALSGIALLLVPALFLAKNPSPSESLAYFNKASAYPVIILCALLVSYFIAGLL